MSLPNTDAFDYVPSATRAHGYDHAVPGDLKELLNENIARIESLKLRLLEHIGLEQKDCEELVEELDFLRSGFLNLTRHQFRTSEADQELAKPHYLKDELILEGIIGSSAAIARILKVIANVAASNLTVLLEGETGTGKELFARIIHLNSRKQKFVAVNCGAFPGGLIESELFGHVKGAFTGAAADRKGKFEEADGGTIFLDEIGELEPFAQVKLLRVLEVGEIQRVGSDKMTKVSVRVIAATNRNLEEMVSRGAFREDLFFRINMCPLHLPPLRERRDEIEILFEYFLEEACAKQNRPLPKLHADLRHLLLKVYDYRGNIRELKNIAHFIACISGDKPVTAADLPWRLSASFSGAGHHSKTGGGDYRHAVLSEAEGSFWVHLLKKHKGSLQKICQETQLSRSRVYQILEKLRLKPRSFRDE